MLSPIKYPLPPNQNHMDVPLMIFFDIFHMKLVTIVAMVLLNIDLLLGLIVTVYIFGMFLWTMKTVHSTWIVTIKYFFKDFKKEGYNLFLHF